MTNAARPAPPLRSLQLRALVKALGKGDDVNGVLAALGRVELMVGEPGVCACMSARARVCACAQVRVCVCVCVCVCG